jgi:hypothetical protein
MTRAVGSLLLAVVLGTVGLLPAVGEAKHKKDPPKPQEETDFATVTAWEVQEFLRLKKGGFRDNILFRLGNATLVGDATDGLCPPAPTGETPLPCAFDARARSHVNTKTGIGPISGNFNILVDTDPKSPLLSDLVLFAAGSLDGTLDLRPVVLAQQTGGEFGGPVAPASGRWRSEDLDASGHFVGGFLIPVEVPAAYCGRGFAYVNMPVRLPGYDEPQQLISLELAAPFQCLEDGDFSLGSPVTKFVARLTAR